MNKNGAPYLASLIGVHCLIAYGSRKKHDVLHATTHLQQVIPNGFAQTCTRTRTVLRFRTKGVSIKGATCHPNQC